MDQVCSVYWSIIAFVIRSTTKAQILKTMAVLQDPEEAHLKITDIFCTHTKRFRWLEKFGKSR